MAYFFVSNDRGKLQIGQSPRWLHSGCLNNNSSLNSPARCLHASSCSDLWSFRHSSLQYLMRSQPSHGINLMSSSSGTPQEAQLDLPSDMSTAASSCSLILSAGSCTPKWVLTAQSSVMIWLSVVSSLKRRSHQNDFVRVNPKTSGDKQLRTEQSKRALGSSPKYF